MTRKQKIFVVSVVVFGAGLIACGVVGNVDMTFGFRVEAAGQIVPCSQAGVARIRYKWYDNALQIPRVDLTLNCDQIGPAGKVTVGIDLGPYTVQMFGINAQGTICYANCAVPCDNPTDGTVFTVQAGQTIPVELVANQISSPECQAPAGP